MDYAKIGREIRKKRRMDDVTQEALAQQVGVCTSFIGHIERGTRKLSVETMKKICESLDMSADELLEIGRPGR